MNFKPSTLVFYVEKVETSCAFYTALLGRSPMRQVPNFALYALEGNLTLGLRARHDVVPKPEAAAGGSELAFTVGTRAELDDLHLDWSHRGWRIVQQPIDQPFGYTFTALDPDGHRLRVMALNPQPTK